MAKRALITGIGGQDGSYMAELLLSKGYEVFGIVRRSSAINLSRIAGVVDKVKLMYGDLSDSSSIEEAVKGCQPHEIYNLGAMSFVPASWNQPLATFDINCLGLLRLIQASEPYDSRIYQASTSEMYGNSYPDFNPISPYGISKLGAHHLASAYRQRGRFISCGICFNHESPRRGGEFVTQKIATYAKDPKGKLSLGNLDASRDWGFAGDFVEAMWLTLQQDTAGDFEIATGETHTIKEFLEIAIPDWQEKVESAPGLIRKNEVHLLKGNPEKIKALGWEPKVDFRGLVEMMCAK
jgi:GDPmannose 4,6-dehydratase